MGNKYGYLFFIGVNDTTADERVYRKQVTSGKRQASYNFRFQD